VGLGNPLLDFIATVDPKYLEKHELGPDNAILAEDKHRQIFTDLQAIYETEFMAGKLIL
jgi:adenosine kinase